MTDKPVEQRRFWAIWLPWRTLYLVGYVALCVYILVEFWRQPIGWLWWLLLGTYAYTWILFATRLARECRSLRQPPIQ
jgi:hypothetical protein